MSERSFTHLHTHTEFSMLDGAARVGDLVAGAVADGQPALGITDHGNMYGVLDFYKACREQGIVPIIGTESYMAAETRHERPVRRGKVDDTGGDAEGGQKLYYHLTLLAETVEGYRNLMQAVLGGVSRGLLLQAARRLGAARAPLGRPDRHHGVPRRRRAPVAAGRRCGRSRAEGRPAAGHLRQGQPLRRVAGSRHRRPAQDQPAADGDRPPPGGAGPGDERQPLHAPGGRGGARRAAVRTDRRAARRRQPVQVRGYRALPQDRSRNAPPLPRRARGVRQHAADRRAGRCADRARQAEPARVPRARRLRRRALRGPGPGVPA